MTLSASPSGADVNAMDGILSPLGPSGMQILKLVSRDLGEEVRRSAIGKFSTEAAVRGVGTQVGMGEESAKAKTWTSCALELTARRRDWVWMARPQALMPTCSWKKGVGWGGARRVGVDEGVVGGVREARWMGAV